MDKKIYVLVPVYNVEKVLRDCLNSIINQTYQNWEAILVDDGSTDKSGKICDKYAKKDKRFRVIHQENGGLSKARYTAINAVTDKNTYMFFLDSDDIIPFNSLEMMLEIAEKYDCDIVNGEFTKFLNLRKPDLKSSSCELNNLKIYEKDSIVSDLYYGFFGYGGIAVSIVAKLFRTVFFIEHYSKINEWPVYFGEDLNVTIRLIPEANRIATIDNIIYYYRYGGGTSRFIKSYVDDCIFLYRTKKEYAEKYGVSNYYKGLIEVEMKNLALQYLIMCIRSKTYPHGRIEDEIEYILNIPEFYNAVSSIPDETLKNDHSEVPGFTQAFKEKNTEKLKEISVSKANEDKLKRFIKKYL